MKSSARIFNATYWSRDVLDPDEIHEYASTFYADDEFHAERLASLRRIGEKIVGECKSPSMRRPSRMAGRGWKDFQGSFPTIMHGVCFLSYIALMSGRLHVDEVLGDRGILHELTHGAAFSASERQVCGITFKRMRALLKRLEDAVPETFEGGQNHEV